DDHGIGRAETTRQAARASGEVAVVGVAHSAASPSSGWRTPLAISATASTVPKNSGCGNPIRANPLAAVVGKRNSEPRVQEHRPTGGRIETARAEPPGRSTPNAGPPGAVPGRSTALLADGPHIVPRRRFPVQQERSRLRRTPRWLVLAHRATPCGAEPQ